MTPYVFANVPTPNRSWMLHGHVRQTCNERTTERIPPRLLPEENKGQHYPVQLHRCRIVARLLISIKSLSRFLPRFNFQVASLGVILCTGGDRGSVQT